MQYYGPYSNNIQSASITFGNGFASAQIACDSEYAERLLNKVVTLQPYPGQSFVGVVTAIADFGHNGPTATLTAESLVNMAMKEQYSDTSSEHSTEISSVVHASKSYKGNRFGSFTESDGSTTDDSIQYYIRRCINSCRGEIAKKYGRQINVEFTGKRIDKTIPLLSWQGETVEGLVQSMLAGAYDAALSINGDTLKVKGIDYSRIDRYIQRGDIEALPMGLDLNNTTSRVLVDSPNITGYLEEDFDIDETKQVLGISSIADNRYTGAYMEKSDATGATLDDYVIDEKYNVIRYKATAGGGDLTVDIVSAYDARTQHDTGNKGNAFNRFGWAKTQVVIDEDLGIVNAGDYTSASYDRTADMGTIAKYTIDYLSRLVYVGSVQLPIDYHIEVGDLVMLPGAREGALVMAINYSAFQNSKAVTYGTITGQAYEEIKERQKLSEIKYVEKKKAEERDPRMLVPLPAGAHLGADQMSAAINAQFRTATNVGAGRVATVAGRPGMTYPVGSKARRPSSTKRTYVPRITKPTGRVNWKYNRTTK